MAPTTTPFSELSTYAYDALGRVSGKLLPNGLAEARSYDPIGRDSVRAYAEGASLVACFTTTYDSVSGQARQRVAELDGTVATYLYDATFQMVDEWHTGSQNYRTTYAYDGVGNRTEQLLTLPSTTVYSTFAYDPANRLTRRTAAGVTSFVRDQDNLLQETDVTGALLCHYTDWPGYWGGLALHRPVRASPTGRGASYFDPIKHSFFQ